MKPAWFTDSVPLDPLIAPAVLFLNDNGVTTICSCEGGDGHSHPDPVIYFVAHDMADVQRVYDLIKARVGDTCGLEVSLTVSAFSARMHGGSPYHGLVQWGAGYTPHSDVRKWYTDCVYERLIGLVDMTKIQDITMNYAEWLAAGMPREMFR